MRDLDCALVLAERFEAAVRDTPGSVFHDIAHLPIRYVIRDNPDGKK